ncbi:MAG: nucleoside kinase, partial [Clostridia bacterium]|nr:nucleoside kinase [Clostridia bacterium]
ANRLAIELKVSGRHPIPISLDNYYKNRADIPIGENGKPDLECIESIDTDLFNDQLLELLQGEVVEIPLYSFFTKNRETEGKRVSVGDRDVLIVEGIHGLNPVIGADVPSESKYRIYVSPLTPLNLDNHNRLRATDIRLLRRLVRDARTRNTEINETLDMWDDVKIGEIKYIYPYMEEANVVFNTTLSYEIPVLKTHVYRMLSQVPADSPHYSSIQRIRQFLDFFVDILDESEIPPISILREFIGGCTFYDK